MTARVLDPDALDVTGCTHDWLGLSANAIHVTRGITGTGWDVCATCGIHRRRPLLPWPDGWQT